MVLTGIIMDGAFSAFGLVPHPNPNIREQPTHFTIDYTFWLNLALGTVAAYLFVLSAKSPMQAHHRHG
jgi:hypothetical protein